MHVPDVRQHLFRTRADCRSSPAERVRVAFFVRDLGLSARGAVVRGVALRAGALGVALRLRVRRGVRRAAIKSSYLAKTYMMAKPAWRAGPPSKNP